MDYSQLQNQINELKNELSNKDNIISNLKSDIEFVKDLLYSHKHYPNDGTKPLSYGIDIESGQPAYLGNSGIIELTQSINSSSETNNLYFAVGKDRGAPSGGTKQESNNANLVIQHQPGTNGDTNQTFFYGYRPPLFANISTSIEATSGSSTFTDPTQNWDTDELAGAFLLIKNSSGSYQYTRQIASNTKTVITIDGTFPSTVTNCQYYVLMPIYFGSSEFPWRQGYFGGQDVSSGGTGAQRRLLRFGYGTTSGADVIGIYMGTGSPEGVVTANVGSIYLRTDGGTGTTLYSKESGTGNTGWGAR